MKGETTCYLAKYDRVPLSTSFALIHIIVSIPLGGLGYDSFIYMVTCLVCTFMCLLVWIFCCGDVAKEMMYQFFVTVP